MPTVEGRRVEADLLGNAAADGEEYAVHSLDRAVDALARTEKLHLVTVRSPVGDNAARVADAGIRPAHRTHAGSSRHADHIPIPQMAPKGPAQVIGKDLDVVVRENADVALRCAQPAVVAFAQRLRIVNPDDLVGFVADVTGVGFPDCRKLVGVDAADDD